MGGGPPRGLCACYRGAFFYNDGLDAFLDTRVTSPISRPIQLLKAARHQEADLRG